MELPELCCIAFSLAKYTEQPFAMEKSYLNVISDDESLTNVWKHIKGGEYLYEGGRWSVIYFPKSFAKRIHLTLEKNDFNT